MRLALVFPLLLLASACQPPAADEYVERTRIASGREAPMEPIDSPDTGDAVWAQAESGDKLLFGNPGETPFFALECAEAQVRYTRYVAADPHAKAILALIGNGHVARLKIDATKVGEAWLWQGSVPADDPGLEGLGGARQVEATVPGAGSLMLKPSRLPGDLIDRCAASAQPAPSPPAVPE